MEPKDFRRIALSLPGVTEASHMGFSDFRVGGRIFATLAAQTEGLGTLILTLEVRAALVAELPELFFPIADGWGMAGMTHIRLKLASEAVLTDALTTAWKLRKAKNHAARRKA
jgi:hypothetical protein